MVPGKSQMKSKAYQLGNRARGLIGAHVAVAKI